jgi:hypothetical protein
MDTHICYENLTLYMIVHDRRETFRDVYSTYQVIYPAEILPRRKLKAENHPSIKGERGCIRESAFTERSDSSVKIRPEKENAGV